LDCDFAKDYWRKSPFRFCPSSRQQKDFGAWCHEFLTKLDTEQGGLFLTLIWGLWGLRNRWVFERKKEGVGTALARLVDVWRRYDEAMKAQKIHCMRKTEGVQKWLPPSGDFLKANVDASTGKDSIRGVGVIVRNSKGETMVVAVKSFRADWDVDTIEAYGVYYGLKVCWEMGYRKVEMEMDSKIVADALNSRKILQNYTSCFIHDAHTLGRLFEAVSFSHVKRSANMAAHKLAHLALE